MSESMTESGSVSRRGRIRSSLMTMSQPMRKQIIILGGFVALIWLLEIIDSLIFSGSMNSLGVQPRSLVGLRGVLLMPFLHGGFGHLLANTIPFIVLGALVMLNGLSDFFVISAIIIFVSGIGVWLLGASNSVHIGASGLIFGFFGFLITRAYFERSFGSIVLAIVVIIFYGGFLLGVLPLQSGVSWLAHLFGFIGGALAAYALSKRKRVLKIEVD